LFRGSEQLVIHDRDAMFSLGGLSVQFVPTCHDALDPVAVRLTDSISGLTAGVATDIGRATAAIRAGFRGCHFLVLESNHDEVRLREARYPWSLKQRIGGSRGHLSNRLAGDLAAELAHPELGGILLVHLSEECNESAEALHDVRRALRRVKYRGTVATADQGESSPWFDVRTLSQLAMNHGPQLQLFAT
jgi:phosphoribosyl 1,2-cyclic phosphodiesterase